MSAPPPMKPMTPMKPTSLLFTLLACFAVHSLPASAQTDVTPTEARAIAKDAYIYGFSVVDNYRVQHAYFVDRDNPEFKAPWNQIRNIPRVYTPEDKTIQTPNSDTPYSMLGLDLRAEPIVLTVPILVPVLTSMEVDLIWFGVMLVLVVEMGQITPPLGINLFVIDSIARRGLMDVIRGTIPYQALIVLFLIILAAFPDLATWLPSQMTR